MTPIVPRVAIFSYSQINNVSLNTSDNYSWFAKGFEVHFFNHEIDPNILVNNRFNLLVFVGNTSRFTKCVATKIPLVVIEDPGDISGDLLYHAYTQESFKDVNPTISAFTPAYKSFDKIERLYRTFREQSYTDWEWIILDDSPGDDNYQCMKKVVGNDYRVKIYKSNRQDGLIGSTKRQAASLCNGDYLMEVDHDDELHHMAFELCVNAFKQFPDAGFCYSDSAEVFETGGVVEYRTGFGMHQGIHYDYYYKGRFTRPANIPINASSIRHIVGVPNHFRCWRRDVYHQLNRHNNKLAIVDDYELLVRTFLATRMVHISAALYIQYMNSGGNNTQEPRRKEIQRLVDKVQKHYDKQIHDRIIELGGVDWQWNENTSCSDTYTRPPSHLQRSSLAYEYKV